VVTPEICPAILDRRGRSALRDHNSRRIAPRAGFAVAADFADAAPEVLARGESPDVGLSAGEGFYGKAWGSSNGGSFSSLIHFPKSGAMVRKSSAFEQLYCLHASATLASYSWTSFGNAAGLKRGRRNSYFSSCIFEIKFGRDIENFLF
jgi:hypothetical protein